MAKLVLNDLTTLQDSAVTSINSNFSAIEAAIENTLSRDGTTPNQMDADLDLDGNDLLNVATINGLPYPVSPNTNQVFSEQITDIVVLTQAEYDAIEDPVATTLYFVQG
jgi:hypothetical protein